MNDFRNYKDSTLIHYGIKGQKYGVRRFQNADGSLTAAGQRRYGFGSEKTLPTYRTTTSGATNTPSTIGTRLSSSSAAVRNQMNGRTADGRILKTRSELAKEGKTSNGVKPTANITKPSSPSTNFSGNKTAGGNTEKSKEAQIAAGNKLFEEKKKAAEAAKKAEEEAKKAAKEAEKAEKEKNKSGSSKKKSGGSSSKSKKSEEEKQKTETENVATKTDLTDEELENYANAVIRGDFGNGQDRKDALGANYEAIQRLVNEKLGVKKKSGVVAKTNTNSSSKKSKSNTSKKVTWTGSEKYLSQYRNKTSGAVKHSDEELTHHGVIGQKWGVRRYQNKDGTLTKAGQKHVRELRAELDSLESPKRHVNVNELSDQELESLVKRIEKENSYYNLVHPEKTKSAVRKALEDGTTSGLKTLAQDTVKNAGQKAVSWTAKQIKESMK